MEYGMLYIAIYVFLMIICYDLRGGSNVGGGPEGPWSYAAVFMISKKKCLLPKIILTQVFSIPSPFLSSGSLSLNSLPHRMSRPLPNDNLGFQNLTRAGIRQRIG